MLLWFNREKLKSLSNEDFKQLFEFWKKHTSNEDDILAGDGKYLEGIRIWLNVKIRWLDSDNDSMVGETTLHNYLSSPTDFSANYCLGDTVINVAHNAIRNSLGLSDEGANGVAVWCTDYEYLHETGEPIVATCLRKGCTFDPKTIDSLDKIPGLECDCGNTTWSIATNLYYFMRPHSLEEIKVNDDLKFSIRKSNSADTYGWYPEVLTHEEFSDCIESKIDFTILTELNINQ